MYVGKFDNFTDCYIQLLRQVSDHYEYISSPRGQKIKESLGVSFTITNPRSRVPYVFGRSFSVYYMVAELIWYLSANDSTEWISRYSSFWKNISDDGVTANSAYGARLFRRNEKIAGGRFTQLNYVINELRRDPESRRAIMHLRVPDDSIDAKLDVPCTLALQFFIREGRLHQVVNMRSSDLIFGISYDIPAFTMFQELIANELGVELGSYTHVSNSLHIYERHFEMAEKILLKSNVEKSYAAQDEFGPMPPVTGNIEEAFSEINSLLTFEKHLWSANDSDLLEYVEGHMTKLKNFEDWKYILASFAAKKNDDKFMTSMFMNKTEYSGYKFSDKEAINA